MREIYTSTPAMLLLVIGSYFIGTLIYRRMKTSWFHPVVVGLVLVIAVLSLLHIDYETFHRGSAFIDFSPSVNTNTRGTSFTVNLVARAKL